MRFHTFASASAVASKWYVCVGLLSFLYFCFSSFILYLTAVCFVFFHVRLLCRVQEKLMRFLHSSSLSVFLRCFLLNLWYDYNPLSFFCKRFFEEMCLWWDPNLIVGFYLDLFKFLLRTGNWKLYVVCVRVSWNHSDPSLWRRCFKK